MVLNANQTAIKGKLNRYRIRYLSKNTENLSESSTRIIVNHLLTDVLGYQELTDIKVEFQAGGGFADYMIEVMGDQIFIVEVKPLNTKLSSLHLSQALGYALNLGINWVIVTNANNLTLYRISYRKPIKITKLFDLELSSSKENISKLTDYLSKKSVSNGKLDKLWKNHKNFTEQSGYPEMDSTYVTELVS